MPSRFPFFNPRPVAWHGLALSLVCQSTVAQTAATAESPPSERIIITGNPLGSSDLAQPSSVLSGERLFRQRASTLGETLDGLPGVASTWFGPNSNRPTIRGLDGDRVRILDNASASVDASNLSFDHAVPIDPLVVERVEVLRGPASLLYGGNATGGVVNTLDNRVPRASLDGLSGRAELRAGGAAAERSASALLEGGQGGVNWHVDAFGRRTDDLRVPAFRPVADGAAGDPTTHVRNSAAQAQGGALGASWADGDGFLGAAVDSYRNDYGVTVEPDVTIRMKRERLTLAGQRRFDGPISQIDVHASNTRYRHQEVEGDGAVGTTFSSTGQELRIEARHAPWGGLKGAFGIQAESMTFSALGEEAFVPGTKTRSAAVFALEEGHVGAVTLTGGLRVESVRVASEGDVGTGEEARFGAATSRRFSPISASLSAKWALDSSWAITGSLGKTQRAPAYYELFANGLHVATAAYERGDTTLGMEQSVHADLGLQWQGSGASLKANLFTMRFSRFISLDATGNSIDEVDEEGVLTSVPEYLFRSVRARLWGLELEGRKRLVQGDWDLTASAGLDLTRGTNTDSGEALPRVAPMRVNLGLEASRNGWRLGAGVRHAWSQERVPSSDSPTPGHSLLNLWLSREVQWGPASGAVFAKLDNVTNQLAYSASAMQTVRGLSPLPGRSLSAGMQLRF